MQVKNKCLQSSTVLENKSCHFVYLVVWRQLHGRHAVDVFFDLVEEVVPASDQTTLVLVVHQIELVRVPHFTDLRTKNH